VSRPERLLFLLACVGLVSKLPAHAEPPAAKAARTDLYGDPLPERALARFGTIYLRSDFQKLAFRADGKEFYSWRNDGFFRAYDTATGKVFRASLLPPPPLSGVQFSADGHFLTLGVDREVGNQEAKAITVWETKTGKLRYRVEAEGGDSFNAWDAWLIDGRTLVTCSQPSGAVRIWDLPSGKSRVIQERTEAVYRCALSPDGKWLIGQTRNALYCWEPSDGSERWRTPDGRPDVLVAPDGRAVLLYESRAGGWDYRFLDPSNGKPHPKLRLPREASGWPAWGADGRTLLLKDRDAKVVRVWDLEAGKERGHFPGAYGCTAMSPDGNSVMTDDRGLQRWDLRTGKPLYPSTADRGHISEAEDLACSPDGKLLVSADRGGSVYFWDMRTSRLLHVIRDLRCEQLAFTPDGARLLVTTRDDSLLVCDPAAGKVLDRPKLEGVREDFGGMFGSSLYLCEGGKLILNANRVALSVRAWSHGPGSVTGAWDLKTGKRLWLRSVEGIEGLTGVSPDGLLAVAWNLSLREPASGRQLGSLGGKDWGNRVANHWADFSPDGALIMTRASRLTDPNQSDSWDDATVEVWERATGRLVRRLPRKYWSVSFAPDGRRLVSTGGGELRVYDVARGTELLDIRAPESAAHWGGRRLAFAPGGRAAAMASYDGSILLWEIPAVARPAPAVLTDGDVRRAWEDLGSPDPAKAFVAAADLADRPGQGLRVLKDHLRPVEARSEEQVRRLVTALDDDSFDTRESAERELTALGPRVWPVLREALGKRPPAESRKRLERLLDEKRPRSEDELRGLRAVRVLEWAADTQARDLLKTLGSGDSDAPLTLEAKAALRRLERRPADELPARP
jgi:WD40 repeat protein